MANKWIAGAPFLAVVALVMVYGLFQFVFIECNRGIAKCESFNAGYIFAPNTNPIKEEDKSVNGEDQDKVIKNRKLIAERYSGRLVWVFLAAVSVLLCVASLCAACRLIYKSSSFRNEGASTRVIIFIGLSFLFGFLLWLCPDSYMPILRRILDVTIAQGQIGMPVIFETMNFINSLSYVASFALVFASCAILLPRKGVAETDMRGEHAVPKETDDVANEVSSGLANKFAVISEQMNDLRTVLYVGTFLLIIGVLRMSAVTQWSLAFISPDAIESARSFYISLSSVTGGFYSLILAAVYLPAAYILQRHAQLLAKELLLLPDKQEEALKSKGLTFSFRESFPRVLAILGPLLAGPIGELFKVLPT